jgi:hypothetical protein
MRSPGQIAQLEFLHRQNRRHGHAVRSGTSSEYRSWYAMLQRCLNPKNGRFSSYGGRGIKVHEPWRKFDNFLADMGPKPTRRHSIDRWPDNDGDYKPSNCRWATNAEQNAHRQRDRNGRYV